VNATFAAMVAQTKRATALSLMPPAVRGFEPRGRPTVDSDSRTAREIRSEEALWGRLTYNAGPQWDRYSTYVGTGLEPDTIYNLMVQRNNGYPQLWADLVEQAIERDGHLGGVYDTLRRTVSQSQFRVHPWDQTEVARANASFIEAGLGEMDSFDSMVEDLLSAPAYGYASSEIVWQRRMVRFIGPRERPVSFEAVVPRGAYWLHPKKFCFDLATDEPLLWIGSSAGVTLPPNKFLFHTAIGPGTIAKRGFMGSCIWLHAAKQWSARDWLIYGKIFGIPQILAKFPNAEEEYRVHREKYQQILKDWGEGIPALVPDNLNVEIPTNANGGRAGDVHGSIIGWANAEISKRVLGSTLTVEMAQSGSYNAADVHAEAPQIRARGDARRLAETLRRDLFRAMLRLNAARLGEAYGVAFNEVTASVPKCSWRIDREMKTTDRLTVYGKADELGVATDEQQFRDDFGLDAPRPGGRAIKGKVQQIPAEGALTTTQAVAAADAPVTTGGEGAAPLATDAKVDIAQTNAEAQVAVGDTTAAPVESAATTEAASASSAAIPHIDLAPTDLATIVTVDQALRSQGLPPLGGADGALTIAEFKAKRAAVISTAANADSGNHEPK